MAAPDTNNPPIAYQTDQNYDIDIKDAFTHFITGSHAPNDNDHGDILAIDDIRAKISVSVTGTKTKDLIASLNIDPNGIAATTSNTTTPVISAQESRCHAFYRILGLPVVAPDGSFYNPGYDIIKQKGVTRNLDLGTKITIANKITSSFEQISQAREAWAANTAKVFNTPASLEASVLALTSGSSDVNGPNVRKFSAPFINNSSFSPLNYDGTKQTYNTSNYFSLVGDRDVQLLQYKDSSGNTPNVNLTSPSVFLQHAHVIAPFSVDPRIDFSIGGSESETVSGISRRIAVPFVPDAGYLKVNSTSNAMPPYIEHIIKIRLHQTDQVAEAGQAAGNIVDYVKSIKSIQDIKIGSTTVSNIFSGNVFNISEQDAFEDYVLKIQALASKLGQSIRTVKAAQGLYYWLPIPSVLGPEAGSDISEIIISSNFDSNLVTNEDFIIIKSSVSNFLSSLTVGAADATSTPDRSGNVTNASYKFSFDSNTSDSLGNVAESNYNSLSKKRRSTLSNAADALQIIEMIMGEFSGFGLADLFAIVGALYVMPIGDLLGLLDSDAYGRAQIILGSSIPAQTTPVSACLTSLANTVYAFYQIADATLQDYLNNNALTSS